jgi:hypothetical protein
MKQALVCKICDEITWIHVSKLHVTDRKWYTCTDCYHFLLNESNVLPTLRHEQQKPLHTSEDS